MIRYGSICSGIEAATVAWHPLGWKAQFFAEIAPFPCSVLKHHYPNVPNYGDFTTIDRPAGPIDVLVGGTPCQSFSVAGKRAGLDDPRGNLTLEFLALAGRLKPCWVVWENVPGVLSDDGGRTFGTVLGILGQLGYGFAYRILDAQYFGVPQRRRRVFVVGCLGSWHCAAAVLFESESLRGYSAPRREAGERIAGTLEGRARTGGYDPGPDGAASNQLVAMTLNGKGGSGRIDGESETFVTHTLRCEGFDASEDGTGRGIPLVAASLNGNSGARTLRSMGFDKSHANAGGQVAVAFTASDYASGAYDETDTSRPLTTSADRSRSAPVVAFNLRGREEGAQAEVSDVASLRAASGGSSRSYVSFDTTQVTSKANYSNPKPGAPCHPLASGAHPPAIAGSAVRRLTPVECERLQGFPDGYTDVPYRSKRAADGPRYAAIGNSMAVPVMRWIGERIQVIHEATNSSQPEQMSA